ncbi:hypothetical protein DFH06DRAFT_1231323 [Mycena polygramma]|nr:hypothetical protein DFH06DRAFT_1231323 [Mycena polygramma]
MAQPAFAPGTALLAPPLTGPGALDAATASGIAEGTGNTHEADAANASCANSPRTTARLTRAAPVPSAPSTSSVSVRLSAAARDARRRDASASLTSAISAAHQTRADERDMVQPGEERDTMVARSSCLGYEVIFYSFLSLLRSCYFCFTLF